MKNLYKIGALAVFGLFFFINIITLNDGHNWGDDFAQYIQSAINLVEHHPYASNISYDLGVVYPPGFPFILSAVIYWFGINFKLLKFLNVLFWALSALIAYDLALRKLGRFWASLIVLWFLSAPFFFTFKQEVLSDIPFMCFLLLSIWTFMKSEESAERGLKDSSRVFLLSSIFCMSYALLIRWAAISLSMGVVLYLWVVKRDWKRSLGFILGAVATHIIVHQFGCTPGGYVDKITAFHFQQWLWAAWYNLTYTFQGIVNFYISDPEFLNKIITPSSFLLVSTVIGLMFLGLTLVFLYQLFRRKAGLMGCFTFFYLLEIILWPIHEGMRYFFPVMIPVTILLIEWIKPNWRKFAAIVFIFLIFQNVFVTASNFKFNDDDIFQNDSLEMLQWVKTHIKPGDNYMCSHPRAVGFLTHRIGYSSTDWSKRIQPLNIKYLIMFNQFDGLSRYDHFYVKTDHGELKIKEIWANRLYKIFQVGP